MKPSRAIFAAVAAACVFAISSIAAHAAVVVTVDKSSQQMTVEVDGVVTYTWPVSTGLAAHDTPGGNFQAFRMEKDHYSKEWDEAPMPNSIFFTKTGHAIHGSNAVNRIGSPASHGCVRLAPENAETLFELVKQHGVLKTKVIIEGDVRLASRTPSNGTRRSNVATPRMPDGTPQIYQDSYQSGYGSMYSREQYQRRNNAYADRYPGSFGAQQGYQNGYQYQQNGYDARVRQRQQQPYGYYDNGYAPPRRGGFFGGYD